MGLALGREPPQGAHRARAAQSARRVDTGLCRACERRARSQKAHVRARHGDICRQTQGVRDGQPRPTSKVCFTR